MEVDPFDSFDAVSVTDCTGLIARAPTNEFELDSYYDIMDFFPGDNKTTLHHITV